MVVDCLEDADDTLKIKTLDLLYRMTNNQNVEAIVEKLLSYLKEAPTESSVRKDLVIKINSLCEDYSPNKNWYVRTMNKLYEMGGDLITTDLSNKFIQRQSPSAFVKFIKVNKQGSCYNQKRPSSPEE